jgi:hypothetical protein
LVDDELLLLGVVLLWFPLVFEVSVPDVLPVVPMVEVDDEPLVLLLGC